MHTVVVMWVVALAAAAQAKDLRTVADKDLEEKVTTIRGTLELYRLEFEDGDHAYQIALDGKALYEEKEYHIVAIAGSYPETGPARVVLLELTTGGSGCPMLYKVVEVKDDGSAVRSKQFGNCAMARTSFTDGVLRIDIPKIGGAAAESWRYQNGKLSKAPRPPRTRAK
jgi:hypothetical protein